MTKLIEAQEFLDLMDRISAKEESAIATYQHIKQDVLQRSVQHFQQTFSFVNLNKKIYNYLGEMTQPLHWVLICEPWCADTCFSSPYILMMADSSERIDLKIALRDENEARIDKYSLNGSKSIPLLICFDEDQNFLWQWGTRPKKCQEMIDSIAKDTLLDKKLQQITDWYTKDRGTELQHELFELLKSNK